MTSKEAVEELKNIHLIEYDEDGEEIDTQTLLQYAGEAIFEPIEKDLAILDILKNIITIKENKKYTSGPKYFVGIREDVILNDETKKIIMDWLNYEKYDKI